MATRPPAGRRLATAAAAATVAASAPTQSPGERPSEAVFEPELVIFDKDGTLIDFKFMWAKWAHAMCDKLEHGGHLDAAGMELFTSALGFNRTTLDVHNRSPICCSPMHQIESICIDVVGTHSAIGRDEARRVIESVWSMPDPAQDTRQLTDLKSLFSYLKTDLEIKVAVCTTDDRGVTEETLKLLGVHHMVDAILCGDDKHVPPKPSPEQILHICDLVGADVGNTIMVGDTITDMTMGRSSKVGLTIGIPGGAGSVEDLLAHADVVLPSMDNFGRLIRQLSGAKD